MPTKAGFWIRVKNGQVTDVWDYRPSDDKLAKEPGWREAVEVMPDLVPNREMVTTHHFDIDVTPAQIVWGKRAIEVEERKDGLRGSAKAAFKDAVRRCRGGRCPRRVRGSHGRDCPRHDARGRGRSDGVRLWPNAIPAG
jgi:hypothetical protein